MKKQENGCERTSSLIKVNEALETEIAARKQAEEAVRQPLAYYRSLIEASGKTTDVNAATERARFSTGDGYEHKDDPLGGR